MRTLSNERVVIVGASSGIGLAAARRAAESGAYIIMVSRSLDKLHQAASSVTGSHESHAINMLDEAAVESLAGRRIARWQDEFRWRERSRL